MFLQHTAIFSPPGVSNCHPICSPPCASNMQVARIYVHEQDICFIVILTVAVFAQANTSALAAQQVP